MPPPITQTSTWTFSSIGPHSGIGAVADQTDPWRGMGVLLDAHLQKAYRQLLLRPPALQLGIDGRRAVDLRQRALLPGLVLALPLRDERVGPRKGVLE